MSAESVSKVDAEKVSSILGLVEENVGYFEDICSKAVASQCEALDNIMKDLYAECLGKEGEDAPLQKLEAYYLELSNMVYFMQERVEKLGIFSDVSASVAKESYSKAYARMSSLKDAMGKSKTTVAEIQARAGLESQYEAVVASVYDHAYKAIRNKVEAAVDMMNALRRVISTRTAEMQLSAGTADYDRRGGDSDGRYGIGNGGR